LTSRAPPGYPIPPRVGQPCARRFFVGRRKPRPRPGNQGCAATLTIRIERAISVHGVPKLCSQSSAPAENSIA
jgi:hypothetical protein